MGIQEIVIGWVVIGIGYGLWLVLRSKIIEVGNCAEKRYTGEE